MERTRRTKEAVWKGPEELQKMYGKDQKPFRRCMERTRKTTEAVWIGPEELKKLYGKDQKNYRRCMERTRSTLEDVWKGPDAPWKMYGKEKKHFGRCMEMTRRTVEAEPFPTGGGSQWGGGGGGQTFPVLSQKTCARTKAVLLNVVICASSRTQPGGQSPWEKAQSSQKKIFCSLIF